MCGQWSSVRVWVAGITTTEIARELWDLWIDRQHAQPVAQATTHKALGGGRVDDKETSPLYDRRAVD